MPASHSLPAPGALALANAAAISAAVATPSLLPAALGRLLPWLLSRNRDTERAPCSLPGLLGAEALTERDRVPVTAASRAWCVAGRQQWASAAVGVADTHTAKPDVCLCVCVCVCVGTETQRFTQRAHLLAAAPRSAAASAAACCGQVPMQPPLSPPPLLLLLPPLRPHALPAPAPWLSPVCGVSPPSGMHTRARVLTSRQQRHQRAPQTSMLWLRAHAEASVQTRTCASTSLSPEMSPSMMRLRRYAVASSANGTCVCVFEGRG
jgi:hypothetical protein